MSKNSHMTITEFLDARIAEDEREALDAPKMSDPYDANRLAFTGAMRRRLLAECAAKRAIIAEHSPVDPCDAHDAEFKAITCDTIRALAAIYAGHPDYQQEWNA